MMRFYSPRDAEAGLVRGRSIDERRLAPGGRAYVGGADGLRGSTPAVSLALSTIGPVAPWRLAGGATSSSVSSTSAVSSCSSSASVLRSCAGACRRRCGDPRRRRRVPVLAGSCAQHRTLRRRGSPSPRHRRSRCHRPRRRLLPRRRPLPRRPRPRRPPDPDDSGRVGAAACPCSRTAPIPSSSVSVVVQSGTGIVVGSSGLGRAVVLEGGGDADEGERRRPDGQDGDERSRDAHAQ